jgi:hypothetical protein
MDLCANFFGIISKVLESRYPEKLSDAQFKGIICVKLQKNRLRTFKALPSDQEANILREHYHPDLAILQRESLQECTITWRARFYSAFPSSNCTNCTIRMQWIWKNIPQLSVPTWHRTEWATMGRSILTIPYPVIAHHLSVQMFKQYR